MAILTVCDGCACALKDGDVTTVGRYDPCVFCKDCAATWRVYEAQERALHVEIVKSFERQRAQLRADLKAAGLARLPDEG